MTFTVLYFATAAAYTKRDSETFEGPCSIAQFLTLLEKRYPGITASVLDSCALSVDLQYVDKDNDDGDQAIKDGSEVAIIPPVSSG